MPPVNRTWPNMKTHLRTAQDDLNALPNASALYHQQAPYIPNKPTSPRLPMRSPSAYWTHKLIMSKLIPTSCTDPHQLLLQQSQLRLLFPLPFPIRSLTWPMLLKLVMQLSLLKCK